MARHRHFFQVRILPGHPALSEKLGSLVQEQEHGSLKAVVDGLVLRVPILLAFRCSVGIEVRWPVICVSESRR
jgi:hypothetical protein